MNLSTYLRAGYPGLAIISSEEARAEAEIAAVCTSLKRNLHAWSSTDDPLILAFKKIVRDRQPVIMTACRFLIGRVFSVQRE